MRRLLARLGSPESRFASVLVAGTNGKGSTAALIAAMSSAAGCRTGLYTSPHLEAVEERLRVDGRAIGGDDLARLVERALAAAGAEPPTYFEALTAAALLHFAERGVERAVLEVGLGGRLDATNCVEPELAVITSIARDHSEHLGESLAAIAGEKAGILRRGRPAVAWIEEPEAERALAAAAARLGTEVDWARREVRVRPRAPFSWDPRPIAVETPRGSVTLVSRLVGGHQLANLGLAVRAAELLGLEPAAIAAGAAACRWPGRLERVALPRGSWLLLDGAHNPAAAAAVAALLAAQGLTCDLLFGALEGKEAGSMLAALAPHARRLILTAPPHPRAESPDGLAAAAGGLARSPRPEVAEDPSAAVDLLIAGRPRPGLVCGSLYLLGAVRRELHARLGVPPPAREISTYETAASA